MHFLAEKAHRYWESYQETIEKGNIAELKKTAGLMGLDLDPDALRAGAKSFTAPVTGTTPGWTIGPRQIKTADERRPPSADDYDTIKELNEWLDQSKEEGRRWWRDDHFFAEVEGGVFGTGNPQFGLKLWMRMIPVPQLENIVGHSVMEFSGMGRG